MGDPLVVLPTELILIVLSFLDLPSLYSATTALASAARIWDAHAVPITEAALARLPRGTRRCIRAVAIVQKMAVPCSSLDVFAWFHLYGHASDIPLLRLGPEHARRLLHKAWRLHWLAQACLGDFQARSASACVPWKNTTTTTGLLHQPSGRPPQQLQESTPISWVEEHRVLRALWRLQLYLEVRAAPHVFSSADLPALSYSTLWAKLPAFELQELCTIADYLRESMRADEVSESCISHSEADSNNDNNHHHAENVLGGLPRLTPDMVQPTWPIRELDPSPAAYFREQDSTHLQHASPGYLALVRLHGCRLDSLSRTIGETKMHALRWLGVFLWDKQRMIALGLDSGGFRRSSLLLLRRSSQEDSSLEVRWRGL
ncbi:hypothetical protein NUU61_002250 [Penicillium alfredii]|uniref:F-box domain-containing protein n=1 Tax=Penicillium alfredii TaxID=1506179 RepID=A0A9W9FR89_9EURO|nr:uncharacterized protein NUU61_002250 [Penicillium alfredii]KAJ5104903.1 hypothetical protein NUU61_002250 [Penicillium alfredii]